MLKYIPDPFDFDKIGSVAANIIAERTKANGKGKAHVSCRELLNICLVDLRLFFFIILLTVRVAPEFL